jgi:hypothetical protein
VTLGGNRTLAAPTNIRRGVPYRWFVKQDGTGSRGLTLDAAFALASGLTYTPTAAGAVDVIHGIGDPSGAARILVTSAPRASSRAATSCCPRGHRRRAAGGPRRQPDAGRQAQLHRQRGPARRGRAGGGRRHPGVGGKSVVVAAQPWWLDGLEVVNGRITFSCLPGVSRHPPLPGVRLMWAPRTLEQIDADLRRVSGASRTATPTGCCC